MITNYNELRNERDTLDGNINRMCVTKDEEEMERMYAFAKLRLDEIKDNYDYLT